MCMFIRTDGKEPKLKIATQDIKVFKQLDRITRKQYKTPFKNVNVESCELIAEGILSISKDSRSFHRLEGGMIHCYHDNNFWNRYQAIIPKGTKYIVGTDGEIASKKILIDLPYLTSKKLRARIKRAKTL